MIPEYNINKLPELFSSGKHGLVYEGILNANFPVVFKLEKESPQTFEKAMTIAKKIRQIPKIPHLPLCLGIVYVKDIDQWGVIYEKIEGFSLYKTMFEMNELTLKTRIVYVSRLMHGLSEAIHLLENNGFFIDLLPHNVLVRSNIEAVYVDYALNIPYQDQTLKVRQRFGSLLFQLLACQRLNDDEILKKLQSSQLPSDLLQLVEDCFQGLDWSHIQNVLSKY